jgi:hypothetical protein
MQHALYHISPRRLMVRMIVQIIQLVRVLEFPEGSMLVVRIPFREDVQVVCNAQVVYSNPGRGVGLRFRDLTDEDLAVLEREVSNG